MRGKQWHQRTASIRKRQVAASLSTCIARKWPQASASSERRLPLVFAASLCEFVRWSESERSQHESTLDTRNKEGSPNDIVQHLSRNQSTKAVNTGEGLQSYLAQRLHRIESLIPGFVPFLFDIQSYPGRTTPHILVHRNSGQLAIVGS